MTYKKGLLLSRRSAVKFFIFDFPTFSYDWDLSFLLRFLTFEDLLWPQNIFLNSWPSERHFYFWLTFFQYGSKFDGCFQKFLTSDDIWWPLNTTFWNPDFQITILINNSFWPLRTSGDLETPVSEILISRSLFCLIIQVLSVKIEI